MRTGYLLLILLRARWIEAGLRQGCYGRFIFFMTGIRFCERRRLFHFLLERRVGFRCDCDILACVLSVRVSSL